MCEGCMSQHGCLVRPVRQGSIGGIRQQITSSQATNLYCFRETSLKKLKFKAGNGHFKINSWHPCRAGCTLKQSYALHVLWFSVSSGYKYSPFYTSVSQRRVNTELGLTRKRSRVHERKGFIHCTSVSKKYDAGMSILWESVKWSRAQRK